METPEGKVSLLDAIPVRCDHILTEWEGDYAVISYPRFKYEWMRGLLLPKSMPPDIHVRLEEHGSAVAPDRWAAHGAGDCFTACRSLPI